MSKQLLIDAERKILMEYKLHAPHLLMRIKSEALLLLNENVDIEIVARFVDRQVSTIRAWITHWREMRLASIRTGHAGNLNASKLTADQRREVNSVLAATPADDTLPAEFWSVPKLKQWLFDRFEVVYESDTSYHFLLRMAGLSFHAPEAFDRRRGTEAAINARVQQIRDELAAPLADPDTLVFSADEVRLDQEAILRRAWYTKGAKTKLEVNRSRQSQSYIGFLDQNTGDCTVKRLSWQNAETILAALTELVDEHPDNNIVIVWDNAGHHNNKLLRSNLGPGNTLERVKLINFPPYAPDHNPIEHVWGDAKTNISNIQHRTFGATLQAFEDHITTRQFKYKL